MIPSKADLDGLVEEAKRGSEHAFRGIFDLLADRLFHYSLAHTGHREDALDLVQETCIELWRALPKFTYRSDEEFLGFVFKIMKRRLMRYYKKREVDRERIERMENRELPGAEEPRYEDYRHLIRATEKLSEDHREVIRLRYFADLSFKEIAAALGISENSAKVIHHRALKHLSSRLSTSYYS